MKGALPRILIVIAVLAWLGTAPVFGGVTAGAKPGELTVAQAVAGGCAAAPATAALPWASAGAPVCAQKELPADGAAAPVFLASHRLGYCHCGCVNQRVCHTSADCGGASCDQFISCC